MVDNNFRLSYDEWLSLFPKSFEQEFVKRLQVSANSGPMVVDRNNMTFEELIDLIMWSDQPEGHVFWMQLSMEHYRDLFVLHNRLKKLKLSSIPEPQKIELIW